MLVQTFVLLGLVCVLAVVTIRLAVRYGYGGRKSEGRMQVLERLGIGARHSVVAIRIADRVLIVSQHAAGMSTLSEMTFAEWGRTSFAEVLAGDAVKRGAESFRRRADSVAGVQRAIPNSEQAVPKPESTGSGGSTAGASRKEDTADTSLSHGSGDELIL